MKKRSIKIISGILILIIVIVTIAGGVIYKKFYSPAFPGQKTSYLYIDDVRNYDRLLSQLTSKGIKDILFFKQLASKMKYPENIKTGKYRIDSRISYLELIRMLRNGNQVPVKLTFNNIRRKREFAEKISLQLMFDSSTLLEYLNDSALVASLGFDTTTVMTLFIPDTYEIYWNIPVDRFLERMKKEYKRFWTQERLAKAKAIPLSPVEVSILASIVEEETAKKKEFPIVAGLYINRLRKGMFLQADPTVKFAAGDATLRRILYHHLEINSPYNTYKYPGLPPGPIRLPSISAIDAVLNYEEHNYLYMCAKEDFSGAHNFAVTLKEHHANARIYQAALNRNNIR
ncbi:MAG: endolytic transglycosylase MltG [Dysgonamonadaceae bacterium]|jgi:UPF0755 protein|nr:endolytic transglycosylase MltG [Dysgonamonadaceae bacterium]